MLENTSKTYEKIYNTVKKFNMLERGDFVVAGVSGGADSMLLLSFLLEVKDFFELRLLVANVEHGIRGEESVADSAFVESFCRERGIEYHCLRINAPELARQAGEGVEEYSRKRRYEFFSSFKSDKIATAHNLSDNVETVLFRLCRGTSLGGCKGIPAVRDNIIRPLIELSSKEIRSECESRGIPYVVDSTNADNAYSRNYIRNVVIPDFEKLNPSFENAAERFIKSANEDNDYLNKAAIDCAADCFKNGGLDTKMLKGFHIAVRKRAIVLFVQRVCGITLDEMHLEGVCALLDKTGRFQIKDKLFAYSEKGILRFDEDFEEKEIKYSLQTRVVETAELLLGQDYDLAVDFDKIKGDLTVRQRAEGDKITVSGRNCTKSLKKYFNELGVPQRKRKNVPVIADEEGIVGLCVFALGERVCSERVRIDENTKNVLLIKITEDEY